MNAPDLKYTETPEFRREFDLFQAALLAVIEYSNGRVAALEQRISDVSAERDMLAERLRKATS